MPTGFVPDRYRDILQSKALGHLATIDRDGRPQVNPVWFIANGEFVYLSIKPETAKYRNLRANPNVAISISDTSRPERYLEMRGTVVEFELFDNLSWVNQLAHKYTGADFTAGKDGEHRYKVTIRVDSWTAQG
jgi:PPOX class probable F420-dependent enzyme